MSSDKDLNLGHFLSVLADRLKEMHQASNFSTWYSLAERAYSDVFQFAVQDILARADMHISMNALVAKINAARRAGVSEAELGQLFCTEYDKMLATLESSHDNVA